MVKSKEQFSEISQVINKWFDSKNYSKQRTNFDVFHNWEDVVGKNIAQNSEPLKFYNEVLVIKVRNSVWTQELQYLKPQLLQKIRESFPDTTIKDLMFRIGTMKKA